MLRIEVTGKKSTTMFLFTYVNKKQLKEWDYNLIYSPERQERTQKLQNFFALLTQSSTEM